LDEEEAVKEFVWVECEEEMVRCLVAADGWGERVGGGDDKRKKKKQRVENRSTRLLHRLGDFVKQRSNSETLGLK
jgi:putative SOS response-associated peptidase YedK